MKCLFIGGPKDGCVIDVDDGLNSVHIPVPGDSGFGAFIYRSGFIQNAGCQRVKIFYPNGEDPIEILMNFYVEAHSK